MYRGRFWTMRQYAGFGTAEQTNQRFHYLLKSGQTGLSTAFDLPTQMGHDSDSERARGEVGRVGVAIDTVDDMERLFQDIDLGQVSTSMTINATGATLLALYQAVGETHGTPPSALSGTIQNDVLKEYMARGTYIYPPGPSMRLITDTFEYCSRVVPKWNPISISGYHIREAGSTAAQEIAFTLGDGIAYVDAAVKRGLDVDSFAGRLSSSTCTTTSSKRSRSSAPAPALGTDDEGEVQGEGPALLDPAVPRADGRVHASPRSSPDNNVVRVSLQALAAVLGGCQSLHTNGRDEALSLPTEASARIALRTQQIVAHESGVCDFIDPLGGAWALESLTDELEAKADDYLRQIDEMGGMVEAISRQFPQREIEDAAYAAQKAIEDKKQIVVGVNEFALSGEPPFDTLRIDPRLEEQQVARVKAFRRQRDGRATRALEPKSAARARRTWSRGSSRP
jgi:methylmalonyl-CoA mutase N-terminal domain/subunit